MRGRCNRPHVGEPGKAETAKAPRQRLQRPRRENSSQHSVACRAGGELTADGLTYVRVLPAEERLREEEQRLGEVSAGEGRVSSHPSTYRGVGGVIVDITGQS